jgi:DNA-binding transcriptional LysR family regulator
MVAAIAEGHGVGIVPSYMAAPEIAKKNLAPIQLNLGLSSDYFRIIYSTANPRSEEIQAFATQLKKIELG